MAEPLSEDLRRHLIVEAGASRPAVAERFGVVSSTVTKLVQRLKRTGSLAPAPQGGDRRSARMEMHAEEILALVAARGDITLAEMQMAMAEHGLPVGIGTLWRFFARRGMTRKKRLATPSSRTAPTS